MAWSHPTTEPSTPAKPSSSAKTLSTPSRTRWIGRPSACTSTAATWWPRSAACGTRPRATSTPTTSRSSSAGAASSPARARPPARPLRTDAGASSGCRKRRPSFVLGTPGAGVRAPGRHGRATKMMKFRALVACLALATAGAARAATPYPAMAPLDQYLIADRDAEIAMARSAAPPSVSADAEVLVLTPHGYVSTGPGRNGFVCLVERAWFSGLADDGFWNPKLRGPDCYNRRAARSVLPTFLTRTQWVLAGASQHDILERTHAAVAAGRIGPPEVGSLNYMLSK